jgi:hypothetical protein
MKKFFLLLIPLLLTAGLYTHGVRLPFFSDDIPTQRYLTQASFEDIWLRMDMNGTYYRPFANLFYKYVPLDAPLWHMLMLWTQMFNVALSGALVKSLRLPVRVQFASMLIVAVFPFSAQAVLWVGAGFHLLLTLLVLLAMIGVLRGLNHPPWAVVGSVAGFLAPFAHESGILTVLLCLIMVWGVYGWGMLKHWRTLLPISVFIALGAVVYWLLRANALESSVLGFDTTRLIPNVAFFSQGFSLPLQFVAGLIEGDAVVRAGIASVIMLGFASVVFWRIQRLRLGLALLGWMAVSLAPAYVLLHPDYVAYGERLMSVAIPAMAIFLALMLEIVQWRLRLIVLIALCMPMALFGMEYSFLHHWQNVPYQRLFQELRGLPDANARVLFINLPSQIESIHTPLPLTRANSGLLTDWLELRDFLWLNTELREFPNTTRVYIPELYPQLDGYRQRVYGTIPLSYTELGNLVQANEVVYRSYLVNGQLWLDNLGQRVPSFNPSVVFDNTIGLGDISIQHLAEGRIRVALTWVKLTETNPNITPFVHLLCDGEQIGQVDGDPIDNVYGFSLWQNDEAWQDIRYAVLDSATSECLQVRVGMYDRLSGERTSVTQDGVIVPDGFVILPR